MYTPYGYQKMGGAHKIGPYSSEDECRSVNSSYFRGQGRCDCQELAAPEPSRPTSVSGWSSDGSAPSTPSEPPAWKADIERIRSEVEQDNDDARERQRAAQDALLAVQKQQAEWDQRNRELLGKTKTISSEATPVLLGKTSDQLPFRPMGPTLFEKGVQGSPPVDLRDKPMDQPLIVHPETVKGEPVRPPAPESLTPEDVPPDTRDYPTALLDKKIEVGMPMQEKVERMYSLITSLVEKDNPSKAYALMFLEAARDERYDPRSRAIYLSYSFGLQSGEIGRAYHMTMKTIEEDDSQ